MTLPLERPSVASDQFEQGTLKYKNSFGESEDDYEQAPNLGTSELKGEDVEMTIGSTESSGKKKKKGINKSRKDRNEQG